MTIKSIQKVIKVGTSAGVTIPAKDFAHLGVSLGDDIEVTFKKIEKPQVHTEEVVAITQKLIKRHKKALKNLSQR
jgi:antitoxin component of MazEF toxin-antitoxin module